MSIREGVILKEVKKGSKKRGIQVENWVRNVKKRKRQSGQGYVNSAGEKDGLKFSLVDLCCK